MFQLSLGITKFRQARKYELICKKKSTKSIKKKTDTSKWVINITEEQFAQIETDRLVKSLSFFAKCKNCCIKISLQQSKMA